MLCSALVALWGLLGAEPYRQTLTSVARNVNITAFDVTHQQVGTPAAWRVTKIQLHGGKQEGVDVIEIDNGRLRILVVPTRGMGIWHVVDGNQRIGWESPVKEIVHPQFVSLPLRGGLGWLDGFGEFLCRCGLESNGHPGRDVIKDNTGAESTIDLTLHGRQAYLPAEQVELSVERDAPYTIRLKGVVPERMMHGPKLRLETELATEPGSNAFRLTDTVVNESATPAEFQILYHTNFGRPLLEEGSECLAPVKKVAPFNERAAEGEIEQFGRFGGPEAGFVEQVYCLELFADENEQTVVALANRARNQAVSIRYKTDQLPYLTLWKNTAAIEDGYVTGIEPGTNFPYNRRLERQAGRVPKLGPKESRRLEVTIARHAGEAEVASVASEIERIKRGRSTEWVRRPVPTKEEVSP